MSSVSPVKVILEDMVGGRKVTIIASHTSATKASEEVIEAIEALKEINKESK